MSGFDVEPEDMTRASVLDEKLNGLLAGQRPAAGDELGSELSFMLEQVQKAFPPVVVPEQVEDLHFARMMDAAGGLPADVTAPMAAVQTPAVLTAPLAAVGAGFLDKIRAGISRRVAAATLALTTAFGGAAYAGILPAPIQSAAANAAAAVGLQLPRPGDEAPAVVDEDDRADLDSGEVTDGRFDDDRRGGDAAGYAGADDGDDERKGTGSDGDESRNERERDRDDDGDDDDYIEDEDDDAEADDATDDHDGDSEDRVEISDDREDANESDPDASADETDDDSDETDEAEDSSHDDALLEDPSDAELESESEAGDLDD